MLGYIFEAQAKQNQGYDAKPADSAPLLFLIRYIRLFLRRFEKPDDAPYQKHLAGKSIEYRKTRHEAVIKINPEKLVGHNRKADRRKHNKKQKH